MTLKFEDTKFQVEFSRITSLVKNPQAILKGAGREVANRLKRHFRAKDKAEPNKLSDRRVRFWLQIAGSVQNPQMEGPTTISVTISDPRFAQKLFGGTIHAKNAGALTIPIEERAYGRTTATFERETGLKLFLVKSGTGNFERAILAVKDSAGSKQFTVEYILTPSVTQTADSTALPPKSALEAAILARSQKVLDRQVANENPPTT